MQYTDKKIEKGERERDVCMWGGGKSLLYNDVINLFFETDASHAFSERTKLLPHSGHILGVRKGKNRRRGRRDK